MTHCDRLVIAIATLCLCGVARAEWVLSASLGTSDTFNSDLHIDQKGSNSAAVFRGVHWASGTFHQAPYYAVRLSYFPHRGARLGTTLDFTHYKMYAETERVLPVQGVWLGVPINTSAPMNARVQSWEFAHGVNMAAVNVQYRWASADAQDAAWHWEPHLGIGLASYWPHAEGLVNETYTSLDYQFAGLGGQVFAGAEYRMGRVLGLAVETKFNAGELDVALDPQTRVWTEVRTAHALGGLVLHF
jgi:hypothetical protein